MNPLRKKSSGFIETLLEVYLFLKISWLEFVNACQYPGQGGFSEELICVVSPLFQVYPHFGAPDYPSSGIFAIKNIGQTPRIGIHAHHAML